MRLLWGLNEIPKAVPRHIINSQYMSDTNITFIEDRTRGNEQSKTGRTWLMGKEDIPDSMGF